MRKLLAVVTKFLVFFIGWALCICFDSPSDDPVLWRLGAEAVPLAVVIIFSIIFRVIEKRKFPVVKMTNHPFKNILGGILVGSAWLGSTVSILLLSHYISFVGINMVRMLPVRMFSCFLNTIMQELLVRGYLYQLLKNNYNTLAAAVVTTILFTLMHGGAFEAGIIPVLKYRYNEYFYDRRIGVYSVYHFSNHTTFHLEWSWRNYSGRRIFASDYPSLLQVSYSENTLLSGGSCKVEGSIVVLLLNILFIIMFSVLNSRKCKRVE